VKVGIFLDHGVIATWQAQALMHLCKTNEYFLYNCTTRPARRRLLHHYPYYLWRLFAFRNALSNPVPFPISLAVADKVDFESEQDGIWQKLPYGLIARIAEDKPALLIKFGMGLLRIPPAGSLGCPVLSYHHGDPRKFRGRPAGFYEILSRQTAVGQIVQILTNELDAGPVVAFAETKVHQHSYRATMAEAYRRSPLLLAQAITNLQAGIVLPIAATGQNYRLPGTALVMKMIIRSLASVARRIGYGAFFQKRWRVALAEKRQVSLPALIKAFPSQRYWETVEKPHGYRFLADPFFHPGGDGLLVEALREKDGRGEILHLGSAGPQVVVANHGHFSYPGSFSSGTDDFVLPEMADWSIPRFFRCMENQLAEAGELDIEGSPRIIDPTMHVKNGIFYLFGNLLAEGSGVLRLWCADQLAAQFREHPRSPVRISPAGSRMGGLLNATAGTRYRIGQDFRGAYGDGVILFEVEELSQTQYRENQIGALRFDGHRGPHTLNVMSNRIVFDYYDDQFSPLAGVHRLRSYLATYLRQRSRRIG
jgi:hypothetical protein